MRALQEWLDMILTVAMVLFAFVLLAFVGFVLGAAIAGRGI